MLPDRPIAYINATCQDFIYNGIKDICVGGTRRYLLELE